jgi:hypothetical protein
MADNYSLLNQAHLQYQSDTGGSSVENPAETLSLGLARYSHLIRAPNSRFGGHEVESPMQQKVGALT